MAQPSNNLDALYEEHEAYVRGALTQYGLREPDIHDACHDVFVVAHRKLQEFRGDSSLRTWLHSIARFTALAKLRSESTRQQGLAQMAADPDASGAHLPSADPLTYLDDDHHALWSLDPEDQDLLSLRFVAGFSITELAELSGLSRPTVRDRVQRASARLQRASQGAAPSRPRPPEAPRRFAGRGARFLTRDVHIDLFEDVVMVLFRGPGTLPPNDHIHHLFESRAPRRMSYFGVYEDTSKPPSDPRARLRVAVVMKMMRTRLAAGAFVFEGPVLMRVAPPIMNAAVFLSRSPLNLRFFREQQAAAQFVAEHGAPTDAARLLAKMQSMRQELDECCGPSGG